jgi:hypothetical protein
MPSSATTAGSLPWHSMLTASLDRKIDPGGE